MADLNVNTAGADDTGAAGTTGKETALAAAGAGADTALAGAAAQGGDDGSNKPDGDANADGKPKGEGEGDDGEFDATKVVEGVLSGYQLPEGLQIAEADKGVLTEIVGKHKLPGEAVRDLVEMQAKREQARMAEAKQAQQEFVSNMRKEADALPKDTLVAANRFIQKFGSDGLKQKMGDPSYFIGNDVDIINAFAQAQKVVDGGFVDGTSAGGAAVSAADRLYS